MKITTDFDSGSIELVEVSELNNIQLKIKKDNQSCVKQWFNFKLETSIKKKHTLKIINAGQSSFANGWHDYQIVASYDQINWFCIPTIYDGENLTFSFTPLFEKINFSYFTPYDLSRQQKLLSKLVEKEYCNLSMLGKTNDGQSINLLTIGEESENKQKIWVIAGQHPGETMAQWFAEGLIKRLVSSEPIAIKLLTSAVFYLVPNMNPDGNRRGNHRTNGVGVNLNRQWANPTAKDSPEVFYVRQEMLKKGVDLFLDIHGDEVIPVSFMMGSGKSEKLKKEITYFKNQFVKANSNFQVKQDYDSYQFSGCSTCCVTHNDQSECGQSNCLVKATDFVASQFGCLSLLLEMPFKQIPTTTGSFKNNPHEVCLSLGCSVLEPILAYITKDNVSDSF